MHDHYQDNRDDLINEFQRRRDEWRARRDARRDAWRARREERRNRWAHFGDPAFWGLDEASLRGMGMGGGSCSSGTASRHSQSQHSEFQQSSEVEDIKATVAAMQRTIATLSERVVVLERLAIDDEARLAAEIEKLRGAPGQ
jgi:hypothetical protein